MSSARPPTAPDLHAGGIGGMTHLEHDPIVDEIHRIRESIAKSHGNDLNAIVADMQSRQAVHGKQLVRREPKLVAEADSVLTPPPASRLTRQ